MSISAQSINLTLGSTIENRRIDTSEIFRSVNIDQTSGNFIICEPLLNGGTIEIYPQSPNNPTYTLMGSKKTITNFSGYGLLSCPLDARFDSIRSKIWIADTGNQRIIKINSNNYLVDFTIDNISFPFSIIPNINDGGIFIRGFLNNTTGTIYYYSQSGILVEAFSFEDSFSGNLSEIPTTETIYDIPVPSSMCFDNIRSRLWWATFNNIYMADFKNNQVSSFFMDGYTTSRGIDVDYVSGNIFIVFKKGRYNIIQAFRDNNKIISSGYLIKNTVKGNS